MMLHGPMSRRPTIILLPGLLSDAFVWSAQAKALEHHADVFIADLSRLDSIEAMARSALALAEGPIVAIGHSMGARVALEMARTAPERIEKLGLLDTGIHPRREGEMENRQALVDLGFNAGMEALADRWLPPMIHEGRHEDRALMEPMRAMVLRYTPEQHRGQIQALLNRPDARSHLSSITCPTLVMVGRQDRWSPLAQNEEIAALIPNSEFVVIEDSGHFAPAEQPEQVTDALLNWLAFEQNHASPSRAAAHREGETDGRK
jgi:pimeloyl-ACP methyl ester carboxylesterase